MSNKACSVCCHFIVSLVYERIDSIEDNVDSAAVNVRKGTQEVSLANRYQRQARERMCCILSFLVAVLLMVILLLVIIS